MVVLLDNYVIRLSMSIIEQLPTYLVMIRLNIDLHVEFLKLLDGILILTFKKTLSWLFFWLCFCALNQLSELL